MEKQMAKKEIMEEMTEVNCLRNERVIVRHINKPKGLVTNPKHVLFGGMADNAVKVFTVPRLQSGLFVNVLTDNEKACLEKALGLEYNALSVHKKTDNFWSDDNESGISRVRLSKRDTYLDLSNPEDYIRYKILLANKDLIAPSLEALQDKPKASYQFYITSEDAEAKAASSNMSTTMRCYMEYGKIENDIDILRTIIEIVDGRPTSPTAKLAFLQSKVNDLIQSNGKMFLKVATDPMLQTKVLIKKGVEAGVITSRNNLLFMNGLPLCEDNEEATLNIAAKYLNNPKHLELKFSIEAKIKQ